MTDAEIIKCLECRMPFDEVCVEAYDLINRQKAEYKDLYKKYCELAKTTNERVPVLIKEVQKSKAELRAEARKEVAEQLKTSAAGMPFEGWWCYVLDIMLKKMDGEAE